MYTSLNFKKISVVLSAFLVVLFFTFFALPNIENQYTTTGILEPPKPFFTEAGESIGTFIASPIHTPTFFVAHILFKLTGGKDINFPQKTYYTFLPWLTATVYSLCIFLFFVLRKKKQPKLTIHPISPTETILPSKDTVSSTSLVALTNDGQVLVTQHKTRGWDIPGGHLEAGEEILDGLKREVLEEAGVTFLNPILIAKITSDTTEAKYKGKCMLIFATNSFHLEKEWQPSDDVVTRTLMPIADITSWKKNEKQGLFQLIELAIQRLDGLA